MPIDTPVGDASIPIDLSTEVTNILPTANGGSGGLTNAILPYQTASGLADSGLNWDPVNKRLGVNMVVPDFYMFRMQNEGNINRNVQFDLYADNINNLPLWLGRARGSIASPSHTQNGDRIAQFGGLGWHEGTGNFRAAGTFRWVATGTWDTIAGVPTEALMSVGDSATLNLLTPQKWLNNQHSHIRKGLAVGTNYFDGETAPDDGAIIEGNVGIGVTSPTEKLEVDGNIQLGASDAVYIGDSSTDGSWRTMQSGDNLITQQRELGVWNTKQTISGA